jgi:hypothetical protein
MKTLLAALALATLVASPVFTSGANAASDRVGGFQSSQGRSTAGHTGTYMGHPVQDWYTVNRY